MKMMEAIEMMTNENILMFSYIYLVTYIEICSMILYSVVRDVVSYVYLDT